MPEIMRTIKRGTIRSQMNLIFSTMRMLSALLDMAAENDMACDTLGSLAEWVWEQAAMLRFDVKQYISAMNDDSPKQDSQAV